MSWLTAGQALEVLGVRPQTLYANVSRRRIRAKADPADPRRSLYHEGDVRSLARKRGGPRKAESVAAGAIEWGDPILPSAISTVTMGRLWYRGQDAVLLSDRATLEKTACLLWELDITLASGLLAATAKPSAREHSATRKTVSVRAAKAGSGAAGSGKAIPARGVTALQAAFLALAARAATEPPTRGRALSILRAEAANVLAAVADSLLGAAQAPLHERLARNWHRPAVADLLRRALVLLADHELNASTFATRVTISTGSSLSAGVLAGLATLTGPLHGSAGIAVWELIATAEREGATAAVRACLERGQPVPGFGHPLYPEGDARALALLQNLDLPLPREFEEVAEVVENLVGERPNIDFALAAVTRTYRLPTEAPLLIFALARTVGWLAHALEQVATGHLIRPRARYVGPAVPD
jgi:citrate synthase